MNKKHILALLILFASWMAFVCYISFSNESIITMIIKKVIYVLVIGIVLPSFFIIRDKKLNGLFSRVRGWSVKHTLRECGKNLRVGKNVKFFNPQKIQLGDNCDVADDVVFAPLVKHNGNNYSSEIMSILAHKIELHQKMLSSLRMMFCLRHLYILQIILTIIMMLDCQYQNRELLERVKL